MRASPGAAFSAPQGASIAQEFGEMHVGGAQLAASLAGQARPEEGIIEQVDALSLHGGFDQQAWAGVAPRFSQGDRAHRAALAAIEAVPYTVFLNDSP